MADNFKNSRNKSVKSGSSSRHIGIKRQNKKKHTTKRKNSQFFKRKRLRSTGFRKKKLKMNSITTSTVPPSANRCQDEDSIALWKARAISLEYENEMLHKHIKQMYMSMIPHNKQLVQEDDEEDVEQNQEYEEDKTVMKRSKEKVKNEENVEDEDSKPPLEQISKMREENRKIVYGTSWRTIIGMETAVQLNYDSTVERNKSKHWPVVPINL